MTFEIPQEIIDARVALAEGILEYSFSDKTIITNALMHPSALSDGHVEDCYERLEFLGDSLVGAFIAYEIFCRFPHLDEGGMTRIKVSLVSGSTLSSVADQLGFSSVIMFGGSETGTGKRGLHSALENVYEAIVAALYLDAGIEKARSFVLKTLGPLISEHNAHEPENPKSLLQEVLQSKRILPVYEIIDVDGPPHDRLFTAHALGCDVVLGEGQGRSKKDAESNAAAAALDSIQTQGLNGALKRRSSHK